MKKLFQFSIITAFILSMSSCYYDEIYVPEIPDIVDFAADIQPVIVASNCASCHDGTLDPNLTAGNEYNSLVPDYVVAGDADASVFYIQMVDNHGGGVSTNSLALIKEWINSGALNN